MQLLLQAAVTAAALYDTCNPGDARGWWNSRGWAAPHPSPVHATVVRDKSKSKCAAWVTFWKLTGVLTWTVFNRENLKNDDKIFDFFPVYTSYSFKLLFCSFRVQSQLQLQFYSEISFAIFILHRLN